MQRRLMPLPSRLRQHAVSGLLVMILVSGGVLTASARPAVALADEKPVPRVYPLQFNDQRVDDLVTSLNKILGGTADNPVVFRSQQFLIVNAPDSRQKEVAELIHNIHVTQPLEKTEILDLTFLDSVLTPLDPTASADTPGTRVDDAIKAINDTIGNGRILVRRARQHVFISGPDETRRMIRAALLTLDSPAPQVQLDLYPIQISGTRDEVLKYSREVNTGFRAIQEVQRSLQEIIVQRVSQLKIDPKAASIAEMLDELGFKKSAKRPMSLTEAQVFLILATKDERNKALNDIDNAFKLLKRRNQLDWLSNDASRKKSKAKTQAQSDANKSTGGSLASSKSGDAAEGFALQSLAEHYGAGALAQFTARDKDDDPVTPTRNGINAFVVALLATSGNVPLKTKGYYREVMDAYPEGTRNRALADAHNAATAIDRQLKSAMDAYATDMRRELITPMLNHLEECIPRQSSGITLAGNTRMVVSSSVETILDAKMASYAEATRPRPFGPEILDSAFPVKLPFPTEAPAKKKKPEMNGQANGADGSAEDEKEQTSPAPKLTENPGAKGIFELVAASNPAAAALLAAAFADKVQPSFLKVAPGLAIRVRPRVLPDNGSARLQVAMRVGVQTSITDADEKRTDVFRGPLPDAVESHEVKTDAIINAFDLFDISSLSFATSAPQAPYYVPILGRIPVIGEAFQFPRDNKRVHHESIILVNATILPRSMDLATRFFNR